MLLIILVLRLYSRIPYIDEGKQYFYIIVLKQGRLKCMEWMRHINQLDIENFTIVTILIFLLYCMFLFLWFDLNIGKKHLLLG